ncbi:hypothetical protein ACVINZ_000267 [Mesorhizobium jarvisii]|jgi:hypothetical protein
MENEPLIAVLLEAACRTHCRNDLMAGSRPARRQ